MKKIIIFLLISLFLIGLVSAENRIFTGKFNDTYFKITPIILAHESVDAYPSGDSDFSARFYPSSEEYHVNESNLYYKGDKNHFYFIADVPSNTESIEFYYIGDRIYEINTENSFFLDDFNIEYENGNLSFSWNANLEDYYASVYYYSGEVWSPLFFEFPFQNSYNFNVLLDWVYISEYTNFKLVVSDGFNEVESSLWFNVPKIIWCNHSDFNEDGRVDIPDFMTLKRNYGKTGTNDMGDADGDGYIGYNDLKLLQKNMGRANCSLDVVFPEIPEQVVMEAPVPQASVLVSSSGNSGKSSKEVVVVSDEEESSSSIITANSVKVQDDVVVDEVVSVEKAVVSPFVRTINFLKKIIGFLFYRI